MNIYCAGAEAYINQIDRIRNGFISLGHQITNIEDADMIYCNDPSSYDLDFKNKNSKAKIIYNVLDLPPHCIDGDKYDISRYSYIDNPYGRSYDPLDLKEKLKGCDLVTCICEEVQWQLSNWCDLESKVIYNPIKNVSYLNLQDKDKIKNQRGQNYKYLYVGRANDPNKRFHIVAETIMKLGDPVDSLAIVGSENPRWGDYYGVVSDETLNLFYNSVEYFFFPSAFKSVGLPALESIVTKTKTIVCKDDPTSEELWSGIGVDSSPDKIASSLNNPEWNDTCKNFVEKHSAQYKEKFSETSVAKNIIEEYNTL
tara:strand:- start:1220 stop:2155 length:936 start_codon:yes stop_codon:yes gene_type:complete